MKDKKAKNLEQKKLKKDDAAKQQNERKKSEAKAYNNPLIIAANIVQQMHKSSEIDFSGLYDDMYHQVEKLENGDSFRMEAMLLTQAHALQAIFIKASSNLASAQYLNGLRIWGTLAMKAQNQCRQTLATLADIRNPKPSATFIKQQNNALNQQVNNAETKTLENFEKPTNELLSEVNHEALDGRGTFAASSANKALEAVGAVNRG